MVRTPAPQGIFTLASGVLPSVLSCHDTLASRGSVTTRALQPSDAEGAPAPGASRCAPASAFGAGASVGGAGGGTRRSAAGCSTAGVVGATAFSVGIACSTTIGGTWAAETTGGTGFGVGWVTRRPIPRPTIVHSRHGAARLTIARA